MLNQNYNEKVVMHSSCLEAISSPCSGVKRTLLERSEDSGHAVSTTLVEFQADSFFDEHIHDYGEELFVLEGRFDESRIMALVHIRNSQLETQPPVEDCSRS